MGVNITLKNSDNALLTLGKAAKISALAEALQAKGCALQIQPKLLAITGVGGKTAASVPLNTDALNLLLSDSLGGPSAAVLIDKITGLYNSAAQAVDAVAAAGNTIPDPVPDAPKPKGKAKKATAADLLGVESGYTAPAAAGAGALAAAPQVIPTGGKVKLADATALHQPVYATSGSSTYHTVAVGEYNAAARLICHGDGWKVSMRIEGKSKSMPGSVMTKLQQAGFSPNDGYASVHLNGSGGVQNAMRAIGALLFATDLPFQMITSSPAALVNKGS